MWCGVVFTTHKGKEKKKAKAKKKAKDKAKSKQAQGKKVRQKPYNACAKCSTLYPLTAGAHSWKCTKCGHFNDILVATYMAQAEAKVLCITLHCMCFYMLYMLSINHMNCIQAHKERVKQPRKPSRPYNACVKCGTLYPLPKGAHSWTCRKCNHYNDLAATCVIL